MSRERSILRPLMLSLTGALVLFWLAAIGLGVVIMREEFDEIFDSALEETAERLLAIILEGGQPGLSERGEAALQPPASGGRQYLVYQLRLADGRVAFRSKDAPEQPFEAPLRAGFHDTARDRLYTAASADGRFFLQVADRFSHRREAVRESAVTMLLPLALLLPVAFLALWLIARRAVTPIGALRAAISEKDGGNLSPVDAADLPRELKPIAHSVNLLLQRLRAALDAEREFTANSAHELRTPVAGALAQTQRLLAELPEGAAKARASNIESALVRLGRISEKLLQLARADAGLGVTAVRSDLRPVLDMIVRDYQRSGEAAGRLVCTDSPSASLVRNVDIDAFGIVMRNLIENAILHGDPDGLVAVSVEDDGCIRVVNDGPPVTTGMLPLLTQRFQRADSRANGTGLGLPIAEKILRQMGGSLQLFSPIPGREGGFEARVTLPD